MIVKTRIFELYDGSYSNLSELAHTIGISVSQIYRIREGTRSINQGFIVGAIRAFPQYRLDELFYLAPDSGNGESEKRIPMIRNVGQPSGKFAPVGSSYTR